MPNIIKFPVNQKTKQLLILADKTIKWVKTILPYAGNIIIKNKLSNGNWEYINRAFLARKKGSTVKTRQQAFFAKIAHGGSCDECAALAYVYLHKNAPRNIFIAVCSDSKFSHKFIAILDNERVFLKSDDVIVDPWPPQAQALLFKHHKSYKNRLSIKIIRIKRANGKSLFVKKYGSTIFSSEEQAFLETGHHEATIFKKTSNIFCRLETKPKPYVFFMYDIQNMARNDCIFHYYVRSISKNVAKRVYMRNMWASLDGV